MKIQLRRDPFARITLMKQIVHVGGSAATCHFCGSPPRNREKRLYHYWWEDDSIHFRVPPHGNRLFCSVKCWEAYNG